MATGNVGERDIEINLKFKTVLSCTLAFIMAVEPCAFDKLFDRSLPSVLEKMFLSLDSASLKKCREVCNAWNGMIKTGPFQRKLQEMRDNEKKLLDYLYDGKVWEAIHNPDLPSGKDAVRRFLSLGVNVNCRKGMADTSGNRHKKRTHGSGGVAHCGRGGPQQLRIWVRQESTGLVCVPQPPNGSTSPGCRSRGK